MHQQELGRLWSELVTERSEQLSDPCLSPLTLSCELELNSIQSENKRMEWKWKRISMNLKEMARVIGTGNC